MFRKIYGCGLAVLYVVLAEWLQSLLVEPALVYMVSNGFKADSRADTIFLWLVIFLCEIIPAIAIALQAIRRDGKSLASQIILPLVILLALLAGSAVLYIAIALVIGLITDFNFGHLIVVILLFGFLGESSYKVVGFIIEK